MKTLYFSLILVTLSSIGACRAQQQITIETKDNDISNNLDLKAVASIFGESKDLQEFELKLNDYDAQITNLDLNNDGEVDYLRVIETTENNVHLIVLQAVLDKDVFQDVATILVEKKENRKTYVQIIGSPYMYGENYIIEPVYVYTPAIYYSFWRRSYRPWISPFYWRYYPTCYHYRRPFEISLYVNHVHQRTNFQNRYYYSERRRYVHYDRVYQSVRRNDYAVRYPDRSFNSRNTSIRNRQEYDSRYNPDRSLTSRSTNRSSTPSENQRRTYDRSSGGTTSNVRNSNSESTRNNGTRASSNNTDRNSATSNRATQRQTENSRFNIENSSRRTNAESTSPRSENRVESRQRTAPQNNASSSRATNSRSQGASGERGQGNTGRR